MKKVVTLATLCCLGGTMLSAEDSGWYLTRKSQYESTKELEKRSTNIRDLITDCAERSISLSCHRAGVWFKKHGKPNKGIKYIEAACALGRGYSCRLAGLYYLNQAKNMAGQEVDAADEIETFRDLQKEAKSYFAQGCFREDGKSCSYYTDEPLVEPKLKKSFLQKIFE